jgi:hypothetical protein
LPCDEVGTIADVLSGALSLESHLYFDHECGGQTDRDRIEYAYPGASLPWVVYRDNEGKFQTTLVQQDCIVYRRRPISRREIKIEEQSALEAWDAICAAKEKLADQPGNKDAESYVLAAERAFREKNWFYATPNALRALAILSPLPPAPRR